MSVLEQATVSQRNRPGAAPVSAPARPPAALRAAQLLAVTMALPMTVGSFVIAVVKPDHHYAAWVTWTLAPVAFLTGIGLLMTAPRLGRSRAHGRRTMLRLLTVALAFSLVKLTAFHEGASVPFLVLGWAVIALLYAPHVRAYLAEGPGAARHP